MDAFACVWLRCDSINAWARIGERKREGERKVQEAGEEAGSVPSRMDYERKEGRGARKSSSGGKYILYMSVWHPPPLLSVRGVNGMYMMVVKAGGNGRRTHTDGLREQWASTGNSFTAFLLTKTSK